MYSLITPPIVRQVADGIKDLTSPFGISYAHIVSLTALHFFGLQTVSDLVRLSSQASSVSELSRASKRFSPALNKQLMQRSRRSVLKGTKKDRQENPDRFALAADTTENPRRIEGMPECGQWGASNGSIFFGLNLLIIALVDRVTGVAYPLAWVPCKKKQTGKEHETCFKLLLSELKKIREDGFVDIPLICDSWFDSIEFIRDLESLGVKFVIEAKSCRLYRLTKSLNSAKHKAVIIFAGVKKVATKIGTREKPMTPGLQGSKYVAENIVYISGKTDKTQHVRLKAAAVYNHANDKEAFAVYLTNDLSKSGIWLWGSARARWNIEVLFRDLKQNLSWGKPPFETSEGAFLTITLPLVIVNHLRLSSHEKLCIENLDESTIGGMLKYSREMNLRKTLSKIVDPNKITEAYKRLQNRRDPESVGHKPANIGAEERKFYKRA